MPRLSQAARPGPALPRLPQSASPFWEGPVAALSPRLHCRVQEGHWAQVCALARPLTSLVSAPLEDDRRTSYPGLASRGAVSWVNLSVPA